jgi:DNA-binding HxlR family transcriptional regulator
VRHAQIRDDYVQNFWHQLRERFLCRLTTAIPPRVDYSLTKFGRTLAAALGPLCQWGTDHAREIDRAVARRRARAA